MRQLEFLYRGYSVWYDPDRKKWRTEISPFDWFDYSFQAKEYIDKKLR